MRFGRLIGELHRRSVWQVLGSYAVVAWLVLQFAETLEGLIGLPLWFGPTVVIVVLLGFPVLLVTALTQGGWKKRDASESWFHDSAEGGDEGLSSWRSLEGHPLKDALRRVFTWRNAVAGGAIMAILLVLGSAGYSGLRYAGIGPLGSLVAKGVFEPNEELILSDFEDRTTEGTLGETVTALFRIDLSQSTSLHLLERSEVAPALARMQLDPSAPLTHEVALELARREGVKALVAGEVLPLGSGAVVAARLVAANSGETLVALSETAKTVDEVPDAIDRISAKMRERMGESLRRIQADPPLVEVTTGSLEALRKYAQAEWASDMGDVTTAEALVMEAIVLDSTFSMAYRKLGVLLSNDERDASKARDAFTKAFEGRERLPDRERLLAEAAYYTYVTKDLDAAVTAYERVLALHPSDGIAGNNLAVLYGEIGRMDKAADLYLRAIERGHAPAVAYANAVSTLFEIGQADSAAAILAGFRDRYPGHPQAIQYSAAVASAEFQYDRADSLARELMVSQEGVPRWEMWGEVEAGQPCHGAWKAEGGRGPDDAGSRSSGSCRDPVHRAASIRLRGRGAGCDPAPLPRGSSRDGADSRHGSIRVDPRLRGAREAGLPGIRFSLCESRAPGPGPGTNRRFQEGGFGRETGGRRRPLGSSVSGGGCSPGGGTPGRGVAPLQRGSGHGSQMRVLQPPGAG